jgi:hypothetical protein
VDGRELGPQTVRLERDPNAPLTAVLEDATALEGEMDSEEEEEEEEAERELEELLRRRIDD